MKFLVEFDCDGAAFDDPIPEIVTRLRVVADIVETEDSEFSTYHVFDSNGNRIGFAMLEKD